MATLSAVQRALHEVLRGATPVAEGAAALGIAPERLGVYARFVRGHVETALRKNFPTLRAILPGEVWARLSDAYFATHPPRAADLNQAAAAFPAFVAGQLDAGWEPTLEPFHVALAQLEWAEFTTWVHPARVPAVSPAAAATLNPTLTVLELACPVVRWLVAYDAGARDAAAPLPTRAQGPELTLIFRKRVAGEYRVGRYVADDDLLFALKVAHEGLDPAVVALDHGLDLDLARAAMARAIDLGLVIPPAP